MAQQFTPYTVFSERLLKMSLDLKNLSAIMKCYCNGTIMDNVVVTTGTCNLPNTLIHTCAPLVTSEIGPLGCLKLVLQRATESETKEFSPPNNE